MLTYVFAAVALGLLIVVIVLGTLIHVLVGLHRAEREADRTYYAGERDEWTSERRELLNRIQHPQLVPTGRRIAQPPDPGAAAAHADRLREMASVGRIVPAKSPENDGLDLP